MTAKHDWYQWDDASLVLFLQVQPRSSKDAFGSIHNGRLKLYLTTAPVDGRANQYLRAFLAKQFRLPKLAVTISRGEGSRLKTVRLLRPGRIPVELEIDPLPGRK